MYVTVSLSDAALPIGVVVMYSVASTPRQVSVSACSCSPAVLATRLMVLQLWRLTKRHCKQKEGTAAQPLVRCLRASKAALVVWWRLLLGQGQGQGQKHSWAALQPQPLTTTVKKMKTQGTVLQLQVAARDSSLTCLLSQDQLWLSMCM